MNSPAPDLRRTQPSGLARFLPIAAWLPRYDRAWLRFDVVAALTTWALVVPQSIAYAQIAGLPPQAGLFTAFGAMLGYALFGTSRQLIVSPASASAAVSASLVAPLALGDSGRYAALSSALAIMTGIAFLAYSLWHLGFVSQFIATSVQTGLMFGLGLTIIAGQIPKLLGVPGTEGTFVDQCVNIARQLGQTNPWSLLLGGVSLAVLLVLKRVAPVFPAALAVVIGSIVLVTLAGATGRVELIGNVGTQLPTPRLPIILLNDIGVLLPGVIALSLIGYAESDTVAESFATKHHYEIVPDQELRALGVANIASGLFQGFIVAGGASQSATNERAGAKTQLAGLIVSVLIALTAIALMPLFANLAQAVLGAIVISAVIGFVNLPALRRLRRLLPGAFWVAIFTLVAVLVLGVLPGLLLAVFLSAGIILLHLSRPSASVLGRSPDGQSFVSVQRVTEAQTPPGLLIFRLDAPLFAINAKAMRELVRDAVQQAPAPTEVVLFDMEMTPELDIGSVDQLLDLYRELQADGIELWLARVHNTAAGMLERSGAADTIGSEHIFAQVAAGVAAYEGRPR